MNQKDLLKCRLNAQEIWAHLGKVDRKNKDVGLVIQVNRFVKDSIFGWKEQKGHSFNSFSEKLNILTMPQMGEHPLPMMWPC